MHYVNKIVLLLCLMIAPLWAADSKIAVVDFQKVVAHTKLAQAVTDKFKKDYAKEEASLNKLRSELQELDSKIAKTGKSLSKTEYDALVKKFKTKLQSYTELSKKMEQVWQERRSEIDGKIAPKRESVFKEVAEKEGYTLIVERAAVHYFQGDDVTQQVIEKFNQVLSQ